MMEAGLEQEARYVYENRDAFLTACAAIGYKEFFPYFEGTRSIEDCVDDLKKASRHYAKRQLTWFRRESGFVTMFSDLQDPDEMAHHILRQKGEIIR